MPTLIKNDAYIKLSELLKYPHEDIMPKIDDAIKEVAEYPGCAELLEEFKKKVKKLSFDDLQGTYSYTFEFSGDQTLDLGHYLFEGFKRAHNLLYLKETYKSYGMPFDEVAKGELPDHLPIMLKFMATVDDEELVKDLRGGMVIKALEKLIKNFDENQKNPYYPLVKVVYKVIDKDVKEVK